MGFYVILLISVIINVLLVSRTQGAAHFTVVPPSTLYVSVGETAKLVWDYTVDNRSAEFFVFSPRWDFYGDNDRAYKIAHENVFENRKWSINPTSCPARLLNPVRVSKDSNATLVIHNVTLVDSGTYGCSLVLATRSPILSKVKLVVATYPIITLNLSSTSVPMNAIRAFFINCYANGTPTPNVTWRTVRGKVIDQGLGKAIINITNYTRDDDGIYKCCATNNPNKPAVCKTITFISAQYKPESDINKTFSSYDRSEIILRCNASGVTSPQSTWYISNGTISKALLNVTADSVLELVTNDGERYGLYKCKAEKFHGYDEHGVINVTQKGTTSKSIGTILLSTTSVAFSTRKVHQDKNNAPVGRNATDNEIVLLAAVGTVSFVLLMTLVILAIFIFRKHSKNKDAKRQRRGNEVSSLPLEPAENTMPVYATVDLSKKKRNKSQEDIPIYAQVDNSKKKRPHQIIYAELDNMHLAGMISSTTSPPLPNRNAYDEIDGTTNTTSKTKNTDPIYACIQLE